ncbi:MAG: tRNA lysidine(34) synthetase TilS, partial [Acidimicrobiia bacterium]|nr:tRNA lysidine(34) synthetase TilS [Acidimicrobiia bacterium]
VLTEALGADAIEGLARSARLLAADDAALEMEAGRIEARRSGDEWYLAASELTVAHQSIASRALRRVLRSVHGGLPGNEREVAAAMSVAAGSVERADLSGAWSVVRDGAWVVITATPILGVPEPIELPVPGEVAFGPYRVAARVGGPRPIGRPAVALTAALWDGEVEIRPASPGERIDIRSTSGPGSKKVSDALAECGIPPRRRAGWPVLSARGNIAWIAGCRPAPWATPGGDGEEEPVVVTFRRPSWSR